MDTNDLLIKENQIMYKILLYFFLSGVITYLHANPYIIFCGSESNDLYQLLKKQGITLQHNSSIEQSVQNARRNTPIIIVADNYPFQQVKVTPDIYQAAKKKGVKLYVEYPDYIPGYSQASTQIVGKLERGVITSDFFWRFSTRHEFTWNKRLSSISGKCYQITYNICESSRIR